MVFSLALQCEVSTPLKCRVISTIVEPVAIIICRYKWWKKKMFAIITRKYKWLEPNTYISFRKKLQLTPALIDCDHSARHKQSSSDCKNGSINSSLADNRSGTFAMHFSMNSRTSGSFTFFNDAGLIPF